MVEINASVNSIMPEELGKAYSVVKFHPTFDSVGDKISEEQMKTLNSLSFPKEPENLSDKKIPRLEPFGGESPKIIDILSENLMAGEISTLEIIGKDFGHSSDANYVVARNQITAELAALPIESWTDRQIVVSAKKLNPGIFDLFLNSHNGKRSNSMSIDVQDSSSLTPHITFL